MMTQAQKVFVIEHKEVLTQIANVYLEFYKNLIWKEKDPAKKAENSAVADRIDDVIITIKNLKLETTKRDGGFTGV